MRLFTRRRLVNALTAFSLLLSGAIVALWVRSVFVTDVFDVAEHSYDENGVSVDTQIMMNNGGVKFMTYRFKGEPHTFKAPDQRRLAGHWSVPNSLFNAADAVFPNGTGFGFAEKTVVTSIHYPQHRFRSLAFPLWLPLLIVASPAVVRGAHWLRTRSRHRVGHCTKCGYDTRANPAKCSECGHEPAGESATV